jgi:excisionase family DNA binding protein
MSKKNSEKPPQLLNVSKAAESLGVHAGTIRRWVHNKQLNGVKVGIRGDWRFTKEELSKMVDIKSEELLLAQSEPESRLSQHYDWKEMEGAEHLVQFYENDVYLLNEIRKYIRGGDMALVIATKEHRQKLEEFKTYVPDLKTAYASGQLKVLDALETLSTFMVDGLPDSKLFFEVIGGLILKNSKDNKGLRIYGEMVAILWEKGNKAGAIQLEGLWNNLQKIYPFTLFCAYPMRNFGGKDQAAPFGEVCTLHSKVLPAESYNALDTTDARFRTIAALQQKARSLEEEIEKRRKIERQKDEFMGIVSHELKTPVTSLKVYAQVLENEFQKEGDIKSAERLSKMNSQISKLTNLIEDLLDITKIESGKLRFSESTFKIDDLVHEVKEEVQRISQKHTIFILGETSKNIFADYERIGQVISNLLTNAIKYSPQADRINIHLTAGKNQIKVKVQDFGVGISKSEQRHIFDRFYRELGDKQETFPGLGLGLYISMEIVKRHGGTIWVESEKGKGSTFCFSLPIKKIN